MSSSKTRWFIHLLHQLLLLTHHTSWLLRWPAVQQCTLLVGNRSECSPLHPGCCSTDEASKQWRMALALFLADERHHSGVLEGKQPCPLQTHTRGCGSRGYIHLGRKRQRQQQCFNKKKIKKSFFTTNVQHKHSSFCAYSLGRGFIFLNLVQHFTQNNSTVFFLQ